jgi:hypothetical protein
VANGPAPLVLWKEAIVQICLDPKLLAQLLRLGWAAINYVEARESGDGDTELQALLLLRKRALEVDPQHLPLPWDSGE